MSHMGLEKGNSHVTTAGLGLHEHKTPAQHHHVLDIKTVRQTAVV